MGFQDPFLEFLQGSRIYRKMRVPVSSRREESWGGEPGVPFLTLPLSLTYGRRVGAWAGHSWRDGWLRLGKEERLEELVPLCPTNASAT